MRGKIILTIVLILLAHLLGACRTTQEPAPATPPSTPPPVTRPCVANITVEGTFITGRTFRTFQDFSDVTKAAAFDQIVQYIASIGYTIASSNKEAGVITSWSQPRFSTGVTQSINVVIQDKGAAGIRVEITYTIPATATISRGALEDGFCKMLAKVESAKTKPDKPIVKPPKESKPVPPKPEPKPSPPPQPSLGKTVVIVPSENLREKPQGKIIGKIYKGATLIILEDKGSWLRVRLEDGTEAWIWKKSTSEGSKAAPPPPPQEQPKSVM